MTPTSIIKDFRSRRALTQKELAGILGVSRQTLISWEAGATIPSVKTLSSILIIKGDNPTARKFVNVILSANR